ncbi:MAG: NUDIX domain-containing protein [Actinobacteria bacterium]|nr:NUDIX domain-containing protein [Actinomycetota bacterium]
MILPAPTELMRQDDAEGIKQQVVGAVIDHEEQILLLQRPADDFRGGTWELPSGKVEPGEDLITALRREITEETGLTIASITGYLGAFDYISGSGKHTRQHTWSVTVTATDGLRLTEHEGHRWASAEDDHPVSAEVKAQIAAHFQPAHA